MSAIEYFYSAHSAFAWIGSARLLEIARAAGRRIEHRPMDLRRVVAATGPGATNSRTPQRRAYFSGREIVRWAEYRGVALMDGWPSRHDNDPGLANRVLIAAARAGLDADGLAHAFLGAHWRDDADLADADTVSRLTEAAGLDAAPLLAAAGSPEVHGVYEANTDEAIRRSVFGSPTWFVDGDMFYGQDHLELIERACRHPFEGTWPPA